MAEDYEALNAAQAGSENDSFTAYRYAPVRAPLGECIPDVGSNTGRGGVVLR